MTYEEYPQIGTLLVVLCSKEYCWSSTAWIDSCMKCQLGEQRKRSFRGSVMNKTCEETAWLFYSSKQIDVRN